MEAEQQARWTERFSEVLNRPPSTIEAEEQDPGTGLDVSTISQEKNRKASGLDRLNAELFKLDSLFPILHLKLL